MRDGRPTVPGTGMEAFYWLGSEMRKTTGGLAVRPEDVERKFENTVESAVSTR